MKLKIMELLYFLLIIFLGKVYTDENVTSYIPRGIYLQSDDIDNVHFRYNLGNELKGLKIINGNEATVGQFPYTVALGIFLKKNTFFCGGALLTPTTILTAAHCIQGAVDIKVFLGVFNLQEFEEPGSFITFVEPQFMIGHPNYSTTNYYNDIAILRLEFPVPLSNTIKTVKLPKQPVVLDSTYTLTISGWGKIKDNSQPIADTLHYYNITGQDYASCASYYQSKAKYTLNSNHICTSGVGGFGPCRGDSGGPLVKINNDGTYTLIGLISLGVDSCEIEAPAVHTETYKYRNWIKANSDYTD